ncbi:hypothetical protein LAZ40_01800 [Cereibacter sphaeroides]|uniref:MBL fold metallo-hydrolase RNA specificity domain-containing protein n=1 Tax=Cereibacter sphaeroides TaxID=1063 RepID=UPI001F3AFFB7|nr:MBL fold metallo-hydrolase RNA specificity domain-containing protein [Cereibacter sphaeroides]MCE6957794.1 hypothetical protein [Cereibacter sphaeroides]MCE6969845.1 hypothetical protein [Cereibacter sphaeroides]MCE6971688.1 hypothetical protein [Cereibacter sphaeroides]
MTPILSDHSAFDAYMLLIEADGRRILYSGDFRLHGRKSILVERMMSRPPRDIDILILEGTNLGTDKPCQTERALEDDYTADVMERIGDGTRLPRIGAGFDNLAVAITSGLRKVYGQRKGDAWIGRMAAEGTAARNLRNDDVVMLRDSLVRDYDRAGIRPCRADAFVWSMWKGYLEKGSTARDWCPAGGARIDCLHTSGHASPADLRAFADAIGAATVIPVHGANWDSDHGIRGIHPLPDGVPLPLA